MISAIVKREEFLVNATGTKGQKVKEILPDESLSDISNLSLLGGRDIKEVIQISEEFKTPLTPIKLDIKDLDIVIKELTSDQYLSCSVWHRLGLQLGLYDPRLVDIDERHRGDPVKCFHACMSAWLRGEDKVREKGGPSWSSLATICIFQPVYVPSLKIVPDSLTVGVQFGLLKGRGQTWGQLH
ncbi:PREDICTED: uncharacterized protein LOC109584802 [Amphimedon queenslandica]|uniref:Death domain-containing protein n=1 Tax=Amphimedon queenslandica TaxID=400682 RepID=A0AAN0JHI5_AMPQE|nr:PREDICTED: uncharacterized protein LOC109584802 [Amphimedon queenslandica]|eukprot:XP_019856237.1 PREDICTED: uncharacterized protein LOC109584802 [Amphimedon queenslandica]